MKITTFNPQIVTRDAEPLVELFEDLGFERRHRQEDIGDLEVTGIRMKDANGFHVDVTHFLFAFYYRWFHGCRIVLIPLMI